MAADRHTHTQTDRHTHTQTRVTTIHFASSTTHAKCNETENTYTICTSLLLKPATPVLMVTFPIRVGRFPRGSLPVPGEKMRRLQNPKFICCYYLWLYLPNTTTNGMTATNNQRQLSATCDQHSQSAAVECQTWSAQPISSSCVALAWMTMFFWTIL